MRTSTLVPTFCEVVPLGAEVVVRYQLVHSELHMWTSHQIFRDISETGRTQHACAMPTQQRTYPAAVLSRNVV